MLKTQNSGILDHEYQIRTTDQIDNMVNYLLEREKDQLDGMRKRQYKYLKKALSSIIFNLSRRKNNVNNLEYQFILVPLSPNYYSKTSNYKHIKKLNLTETKLAIDILKKHKIVDYELGERGKEAKLMTKVWFRDLLKWNLPINMLHKWDIVKSAGSKGKDKNTFKHVASLKIEKNETKNKKISKKKRKYYYIKAPYKQRQIVKEFNNYMKNEKGVYNFDMTRNFGETQHINGRYFYPFNNMSKVDRTAVIKQMGLVELDYEAFNFNIAYLLKTGMTFKEMLIDRKFLKSDEHLDPYVYFVLILLMEHNDIKTKDDLTLKKNIMIYRQLLKQCCNIMLSSKSKDEARQAIQYIFANELYINTGLSEKQIRFMEKNIPEWLLYDEHDEKIKAKKSRDKKYFLSMLKSKGIDYTGVIHLQFDVDIFMQTFERVHEPIKEYFYSDFSKISMLIESNILTELMQEMIKDKLYLLTAHDCIYVPEQLKKKYKNLQKKLIKDKVQEYIFLIKEKNVDNYRTLSSSVKELGKDYFQSINYFQSIYNFITNIIFKGKIIFKIYSKKVEYCNNHPPPD